MNGRLRALYCPCHLIWVQIRCSGEFQGTTNNKYIKLWTCAYVSLFLLTVFWMNEWCIYIALYCVLLYTQSTLQSCGGGGSLLNHHQCAAYTWLPQDNGASALTTHQQQVERRESHRANQVDGDYWEAMIDKGQWWEFGQDTGVTPLLFTRSAIGFLMTTESQDLGLMSHPFTRPNPFTSFCSLLLI